MTFSKKDLKKFLKKELITLAKENDFGFNPKSRMSKIQLIELIFISPNFKIMKDNLQKKPKRVVSQKVLDNLQKGRENRKTAKKTDTTVEFYAPEKIVESKTEEKLVKPKEEKITERVIKPTPEFIVMDIVDAPKLQVAIENEGVPYESIMIDNERVQAAQNNSILQKGAETVTGLSGEQKSIITEAKVDRQQRRLDIVKASSTDDILAEMELVDTLISESSDQKEIDFYTLLILALQTDKIALNNNPNEEFSNSTIDVISNPTQSNLDKNIEGIVDVETEQKEEPSNLNIDRVTTNEELSSLILSNQDDQKKMKDVLEKELLKMSRADLLELSGEKYGKKLPLAKIIIKELPNNFDIFKRLMGKDSVKETAALLKMAVGTEDALKSEREKIKREQANREISQQQNAINGIQDATGHNQLVMDSLIKLEKKKQLNKTMEQRTANSIDGKTQEELNSSFSNRLN